MKKIGQSVYTYKGYIVDGYEAGTGLDWRIFNSEGDWIMSLSRKKDCKDWIDHGEK